MFLFVVGLLFFCSLPSFAHAAIAVAVSGAAQCYGGGVCNDSSGVSGATMNGNQTTFTYTFTVAAGTNQLLIVSVMTSNSDCSDNNGYGIATTSSVTYGGEALTNIGTNENLAGCTSPSNGVFMQHWYLLNPPTGSNNLVITLSTALPGHNDILSAFSALTGVNQSTPIRGFNASDSGDTPGLSASTTVSSATNDLVWDSVCGGGSVDSTTEVPQVILNVDDTTTCDNIGASTQAGAASVTMNWDVNSADGGDYWTDFASSIEPAGTAVIGRIIRLIGGVDIIGGVRFY